MDNEAVGLAKYAQIEEYYRNEMENGTVQAGNKLPSESEMVKKFKVSRHTVRQALMHLEKDGYIYREQGKGAFCSYSGKKEPNKTVAVLTTYISNYIFPPIISGIEEVLSSYGYTLALYNTNNEKAKEAEYLKKIMDSDISGIIVEPTMSALPNENEDLYNELKNKNIPFIMINAFYNEIHPSYVIMDDEEGGYRITRLMTQFGHKTIAGIFKSDDLQGVKRLSGYERALKEAGIEADESIIGKFNTDEKDYFPYEFARKLLQREERPTAIVCYNDQAAFSVLQAVREEGLRVPEDISVSGYDDSDIASAHETKLTTIRHPKDEMGRRAARYLVDMLEKKEEKQTFIYEPELVVRNSVSGKE